LEFTFPTGLTLIDGPNGVGKSNLLDAWFWCRYGWLPKWEGPKGGRADAVIRRGFEKTKVTSIEQIGRDEITIERQRPHKLTVWKNGEKLKACSQDDLEKILGMSPERCLICVYLAQKRKRTFFSMSDAERMELLSTVAGLEELDRALEKAKGLKATRQNDVTSLEGKVQLATEWLQEFPHKIAIAKERYDKADEAAMEAGRKSSQIDHNCSVLIQEHQSAYLSASKQIKSETEKVTSALGADILKFMNEHRAIQEQMKLSPKPEPELFTRLASTRDQLQKHEALVRERDRIKDGNLKLLEKIQRELDEMVRSKDGKCGKCSQSLPTWELQVVASNHLKKAQEYEAQIRPEIQVDDSLKEMIETEVKWAEEALAKRKAELEILPRQLESQASASLSNYQKLVSEQKSVQSKMEMEISTLERKMLVEVDSLDREMTEAKRTHFESHSAMERAEEDLQNIKKEQASKVATVSELKDKLTETASLLDEALDLIEIFGPKGYRSVCFDGLIQRISDRAGQLISILSDGVYSTYLEQVGSDSKGNQKMVLLPVILRSGQQVYTDDLSGGFEDRVALAYDLAVSEAAGDGLPLLPDEVLKGLDAQGKVEAMSLLEEVAKTRPVLVIEHTTEMKAMFHQVIKITHENDQSHLVEGV
jgi:DNA repair exonuclease SbcCD ATPase subunit